MKIIYVTPQLGIGGGPKVIAEHVSHLCSYGQDAQVWSLTGCDFGWFHYPVPIRRFTYPHQLVSELKKTEAIKIATTPITTEWVVESCYPHDVYRHYYLIQDEDEKTYEGKERGASYQRGLLPLFEGTEMQKYMEDKYKVKGGQIGIGLDKRSFFDMKMERNRFRILTPYRPSSGGPNDLKGWDLARHVIKEMKHTSVRDKVSLVTYGIEDGPTDPAPIPHIHVKYPTDSHLAELYNTSGVFLSCSKHEGFGLPMLEAMACGLPVVCTDAFGNREFCTNKTSVLHKDRNPREIALSLADVLDSKFKWHELYHAGKLLVPSYRWDKVMANLFDLFSKDWPEFFPQATIWPLKVSEHELEAKRDKSHPTQSSGKSD